MLDYILSDTHMYNALIYYEILDEGTISTTSDHLPIIAVFRVQNTQHYLIESAASKTPAWHKISKELIQKYETEIGKQLETKMGNDIPETVSKVNQFYATFVECITACANTVVPKSKFNPHSKPFWTKEVKQAHAQEREMRSIWVSEGRPRGMHHPSFCKYKRAKRQFRKCQSLAFEQYIKNTYTDIDNAAGCDVRLFWKLISKQKPRQNRIYPEIIYDGKTANSPDSVAEVFASYFEDIYTPQNNKSYKEENLLNINAQYKDIKMCKTQDMRLEHEITESEVADAVSTLKLRKAPGIDGIQAEHLKYGGRTAILYLCKLFNGIIKIGIIPREWKKRYCYTLIKGMVR